MRPAAFRVRLREWWMVLSITYVEQGRQRSSTLTQTLGLHWASGSGTEWQGRRLRSAKLELWSPTDVDMELRPLWCLGVATTNF